MCTPHPNRGMLQSESYMLQLQLCANARFLSFHAHRRARVLASLLSGDW